MISFPYALPNVVSALFILTSAFCIIFALDETHPALRNKPDYGRRLGKMIFGFLFHRQRKDSFGYEYTELSNQVELQEGLSPQGREPTHGDGNADEESAATSKPVDFVKPTLKFRQIFSKNVVFTLLAHHLLALHLSAFNALIFLFLPASRSDNQDAHLPFSFTGGLGLGTDRVGLATAIIGVIGFPMQIFLYPKVNGKLGTLPSYKFFLPFSILAYALTPFLALLPDKALLVWPSLTVALALQVISRTFALPSATILVNNCTPHPSVLGTIHGVAQSISSGARTVGPTLGGWLLGVGLGANCVGAVWWAIAGVAAVNWLLLWLLYEGDAGTAAAAAEAEAAKADGNVAR
jgi:hypothetical protein